MASRLVDPAAFAAIKDVSTEIADIYRQCRHARRGTYPSRQS
jgi:hypothetical protein